MVSSVRSGTPRKSVSRLQRMIDQSTGHDCARTDIAGSFRLPGNRCLLMGTADDAVDGYDRSGALLVDEEDDRLGDFRIGSRIGSATKPPPCGIGIRTFIDHNADRHLRRMCVVGAIKGDRCDCLAAESLATLFRELVTIPRCLQCHFPLQSSVH